MNAIPDGGTEHLSFFFDRETEKEETAQVSKEENKWKAADVELTTSGTKLHCHLDSLEDIADVKELEDGNPRRKLTSEQTLSVCLSVCRYVSASDFIRVESLDAS